MGRRDRMRKGEDGGGMRRDREEEKVRMEEENRENSKRIVRCGGLNNNGSHSPEGVALFGLWQVFLF